MTAPPHDVLNYNDQLNLAATIASIESRAATRPGLAPGTTGDFLMPELRRLAQHHQELVQLSTNIWDNPALVTYPAWQKLLIKGPLKMLRFLMRPIRRKQQMHLAQLNNYHLELMLALRNLSTRLHDLEGKIQAKQ